MTASRFALPLGLFCLLTLTTAARAAAPPVATPVNQLPQAQPRAGQAQNLFQVSIILYINDPHILIGRT